MSQNILQDISLDKILSEIYSVNKNPVCALAFIGSRAAGYANEKSDYDFLAVIEDDFPLTYNNFCSDGKPYL